VSQDIFKEVQSIEGEADHIIQDARKKCADIRAELTRRLEDLTKKRQDDFAARKQEIEAAASLELQAELGKLRESHEINRARLEKFRDEQLAALVDSVVERFGEVRQ